MENNNVLLVFGGNSFEHDISIITALTIYNRAKASKYKLLPLYLSKSNEWFLFCGEKLTVNQFKDFEDNYKKNGFVKSYFKNNNHIYVKKGLFEKNIEILAAINCCHGGIGENGTLTAYFNMLNIPISSGGVLSEAVGMDKVISKYVFNELNLPTIKYFTFTKKEFNENKESVIKKIKRLDYPLILKPASLGSSIGIKIAKNQKEFIESATVALEFDNVILVEKAILDNLREFNVAVMKYNNDIIVSDIDEPKRTDEILSFKDKYIGDDSSKNGLNRNGKKFGAYVDNKTSCGAINEKTTEKLKEFSKKIYKELDFVGPVRIDFIVGPKNKIYVNEINTIPGSLAYYFFIPKYFKTMNNYVDALIKESIDYHKTINKIKKEFITKLI